MTDFTFEVSDQGPDGIDLNIHWGNFNAISLSVSTKQLKKLRSEIDDVLKEMEKSLQ